MMLMGAHFVFWFFVLFLIEIDLGKRLRRCYTRCCHRKIPMKEDNDMDEDVLAEEKRVKETPNEEFRIKVESLRKVYWIGQSCGTCCRRRRKIARK